MQAVGKLYGVDVNTALQKAGQLSKVRIYVRDEGIDGIGLTFADQQPETPIVGGTGNGEMKVFELHPGTLFPSYYPDQNAHALA